MISEAAIANALVQRFEVRPLLWDMVVVAENKSITIDKSKMPFIETQIVPTSRTDRSMRGGSPISRGFMMATIVAPKNQFATPARELADLIISIFPARLVLPITGGRVIIGDVEPMPGYPDAVSWRQPVRIRYSALKA